MLRSGISCPIAHQLYVIEDVMINGRITGRRLFPHPSTQTQSCKCPCLRACCMILGLLLVCMLVPGLLTLMDAAMEESSLSRLLASEAVLHPVAEPPPGVSIISKAPNPFTGQYATLNPSRSQLAPFAPSSGLPNHEPSPSSATWSVANPFLQPPMPPVPHNPFFPIDAQLTLKSSSATGTDNFSPLHSMPTRFFNSPNPSRSMLNSMRDQEGQPLPADAVPSTIDGIKYPPRPSILRSRSASRLKLPSPQDQQILANVSFEDFVHANTRPVEGSSSSEEQELDISGPEILTSGAIDPSNDMVSRLGRSAERLYLLSNHYVRLPDGSLRRPRDDYEGVPDEERPHPYFPPQAVYQEPPFDPPSARSNGEIIDLADTIPPPSPRGSTHVLRRISSSLRQQLN